MISIIFSAFMGSFLNTLNSFLLILCFLGFLHVPSFSFVKLIVPKLKKSFKKYLGLILITIGFLTILNLRIHKFTINASFLIFLSFAVIMIFFGFSCLFLTIPFLTSLSLLSKMGIFTILGVFLSCSNSLFFIMLINDISYIFNPNKRKQVIDSHLQTALIFMITKITGLLAGLIFAILERPRLKSLHLEMTSFEKTLIFELSAVFGALAGVLNETLRKQVVFLIFWLIFSEKKNLFIKKLIFLDTLSIG